MRGKTKVRSAIAAAMLVVIAAAASFAQGVPVRPIDDPILPGHGARPHPTIAPPISLPTPRGTMTPLPSPSSPGAAPIMPADILSNSRLGPKIPLSSLPHLPAQTPMNTYGGGSRRPMAATDASIMYTTVSGCSSTIGYIFNIGCTIDFQLAYCNTSNTNANCNGTNGTTSITRTDTFQDYYIDGSGANSATAQTIGNTYVPNTTMPAAGSPYTCTNTSTCTYGPAHNLTLNNAGTVVLASYDVTKGVWVAVVYITVGSASALETFSDTQRLNPNTAFTIPSSGTNTVYITIGNAQYSDTYVVYIENTSVYTNCTGIIGPTPAGPSAGLCNPTAITGTKALSSGNLYMQWTFGAGTNWTSLTTGTYSLVAYDQTAQKRVAQTQISLTAASGAVGISLTGVAGNPSPAPAATPSTRFAFDSTADASTLSIVQNYSGLTSGHKYCFSFADPQGRVYSDYTTPTEKFTCTTANGTTMQIAHTNVSSEQPDYFAPNTYTVQVCDFSAGSPCTMVGSEAFQILGYHMTTNFMDQNGATVGTSLVVPKNGTTTGGVYFLNDGDTYYGAGNGDPITAIMYSTANGGGTGDGAYLSLSCGTSCTQTVQDTSGQNWYVYETQHSSGAKAYTTLEICPTSWGTTCSSPSGSQSLAMNASITVTGITFYPPPGSSSCTGGNCQVPTSILPSDGQSWSGYGSSQSTVLNYFTNSNGNTYTGTGSFIHVGVIPSGCSGTGCTAGFSGTIASSPCTPTSSGYGGVEQHGYYTNLTQALYAASEPFTASTGQADVYCVNVTNNSTSGTITGLAFNLPSTYSGASTTTWSVDVDSASGGSLCSGSNTCWAKDTTSGKCPTNANFCIKPVGVNSGIQVGQSQTIYLDVQNLPSSSFSFAEVAEQVYNPVSYSLTPDPACCTSTYLNTIPVGSTAPTQMTIDALALGAYSLDASYMTPLFNPTSEGTGTTNTVNISLKNTSLAQDTNPDYVDAIVFEFPGTSYLGTTAFAPTGLTSGWNYLGYVSPGVGGGGTVDYWFGVCTAQYSTANGPLANPTSSTAHSLPLYAGAGNASGCTATQEQSALSPGSSFSFTTPFAAPSSPGSVTSTVYAHGANGNGWSKSQTFSLTIAAVSATAGFSKAGTYGSPSSVPSNTTPAISTDSNKTYGNSYVYTITNTSGAGNNLTSATITVPGKDSSGALPSDGTAWTITSAPAISGPTYGCTLSTSANNGSATTSGGNGTISLTGCTSFTPNSTITIVFTAKAPYTVNDQYQFPATVNGSIAASENWVGDTYVQIVLGASLVITVGPTQNANGYAYSFTCPTCAFTQATNTIDFGNIAAGASATGTDVALLDLYTNASSPQTWSVYVTQQNSGNPTAAAYLQTSVDNTSSSGCPTANSCISFQPKTGTAYGTTAYTAIPITGNATSGLVIGSTSSGTAATRLPFEFSNNYRIAIPAGGNTSPSVSTVTYTFIAN